MSRGLGSVAALAAAVSLLAAACGGSEPAAPGEAGQAPTQVRVGVLPIAPLAPLYLGMDQGFFEQEGLAVEPVVAQGGAAIVPAVVSGEQEFGFSNIPTLMQAQIEGLPLTIVAKGSQTNSEAERDFAAVIVGEDSPIQGPADLADATIAVNTLNNIGDLAITAALEGQGVDTSRVEFTEVPFPDMNAALTEGRVDAIWQEEPFLTQALADGARIVLEHYREVDPDLPVAGYFTTREVVEAQPELVAAFQRAMTRSLAFAQDNPKAAREAVVGFAEIPPETAQEMTLPGWGPVLDGDALRTMSRLGVEQGIFERPPDLEELVYQAGP